MADVVIGVQRTAHAAAFKGPSPKPFVDQCSWTKDDPDGVLTLGAKTGSFGENQDFTPTKIGTAMLHCESDGVIGDFSVTVTPDFDSIHINLL